MTMSTAYADAYRKIDFREHPEKYSVGRGEQGVLIAEPYKSEILPHWKFKTEEAAETSAQKIYQLFLDYKADGDFVGMDMARKFLQMGFTRARRYANHPSGTKYDGEEKIKPQHEDALTSEKAKAARVFYKFYEKAKNDEIYVEMKKKHQLAERRKEQAELKQKQKHGVKKS